MTLSGTCRWSHHQTNCGGHGHHS